MGKKIIIAVDIGSESIKVFAANIPSRGCLAIVNSGFVPSLGYVKGEIEDYFALSSSIKQAVDCVVSPEINQADILIYLGIGACFLQGQIGIGSIAPAALGKVSQDDIDRACRAAVFASVNEQQEVLHAFPIDNFPCLSYAQGESPEMLEESGGLKVTAHIVTAPKHAIDKLTEALESEGLTVSGIVSNNIVTAQTVIAKLENNSAGKKPTGIFFDIGAGTVGIAIFEEGLIKYSASLPLGGNYITRDIMHGIEVSFVHAEDIKRYYSKMNKDFYGQKVTLDCNDFGTTDKHIPYDFLYDIIESRIDEIVYLVHQDLKPKLAGYLSGKPLDKLVLAGGSSSLPSLVAKLAKAFDTEAQVVNFEELNQEYNFASNAACYGILRHVANQLAPQSNRPAEFLSDSANSDSKGTWQLLGEKLRRFFK